MSPSPGQLLPCTFLSPQQLNCHLITNHITKVLRSRSIRIQLRFKAYNDGQPSPPPSPPMLRPIDSNAPQTPPQMMMMCGVPVLPRTRQIARTLHTNLGPSLRGMRYGWCWPKKEIFTCVSRFKSHHLLSLFLFLTGKLSDGALSSQSTDGAFLDIRS